MEIPYGQLFYWSVHCLIFSVYYVFNKRKFKTEYGDLLTTRWNKLKG